MSMPVNRIIFPSYVHGANTTLKPISATEAFQKLIETDSMLGYPLNTDKVADLVQWVQDRPASVLEYDSLDEAVKVIEKLCNLHNNRKRAS